MLVSELEKKPEISMRIASAVKSKTSDVSFKSAVRLCRSGIEMVDKSGQVHKPCPYRLAVDELLTRGA